MGDIDKNKQTKTDTILSSTLKYFYWGKKSAAYKQWQFFLCVYILYVWHCVMVMTSKSSPSLEYILPPNSHMVPRTTGESEKRQREGRIFVYSHLPRQSSFPGSIASPWYTWYNKHQVFCKCSGFIFNQINLCFYLLLPWESQCFCN